MMSIVIPSTARRHFWRPSVPTQPLCFVARARPVKAIPDGAMTAKLVSVLLVAYLSSASALYFHIAETERKCFIEEIPDETMVIGEFVRLPQRSGHVITPGPAYEHVILCQRTSTFYVSNPVPCILGNYKVQLYEPKTGGFMPSSPGIGMHVEVKDPDDKVVLSRVTKTFWQDQTTATDWNCFGHCRYTAQKEDLPSPRTHLVNMSFACIPTAPSGFQAHNW